MIFCLDFVDEGEGDYEACMMILTMRMDVPARVFVGVSVDVSVGVSVGVGVGIGVGSRGGGAQKIDIVYPSGGITSAKVYHTTVGRVMMMEVGQFESSTLTRFIGFIPKHLA